ncbi:MAG: lipid II flippase MurJ, partial [Bacillota bacterium]|nr:lipid II flippase MurJ [Bacillota bacterium]
LGLGAASIQGLAWYTLIGMAVPVVLLIVVAMSKGLPLLDRPRFNDPAFTQVLRLSAPIFVGSLFGQLYMIVDRSLASGLDAGSMASLNFANKLVQLPVGIFVTALATAVYPTLAEYAARGDKRSFAEAVSSSIRGLALLMIPAAVGLYVLRYPIVRLAFERGSFDATATAKTAVALGYYAVGLLGLSAAQVLARAFYALQDTATPVKIGIATALVNIVLAVMLVGPLNHGGLALANSLGFLFNAGVLLYILRTKVEKGALSITPVLTKGTVAALVMGLVSSVVLRQSAALGQVVSLGAAVSAGLVVYAVALVMLKVDEVWLAINVVQRKMGIRIIKR